MQKKAIPFAFDFPIIHRRAGERLHVCTLIINAVCYRYEDGTLLLNNDGKPEIDFDGIEYDGKNISLLLETVAEETHYAIRETAQELALEKQEVSEAEEFGNFLSDHSEQPLIGNL